MRVATRTANPKRWRKWTSAHRATAAGFLTLLIFSWWQQLALLQGSPTATRLFGLLPFVDPLAALEVLVAARSVTITMILGVCIPLVMTLFLGRFFCGWLCPLGLLLDLAADVRERLRRFLPRHDVRLPLWSPGTGAKYWVLAACVMTSVVASVPLFTLVSPINLVMLGIVELSLTATVVIGAILLVELLVPRMFCRSICPLGALYSLVGRRAPLRVQVRAGGEKLACGQCTMRCPMGIRVMQDHVLAGHRRVTDPECTRCGSCADACAGQVLRLGFRQSPQLKLPPCQHDP